MRHGADVIEADPKPNNSLNKWAIGLVLVLVMASLGIFFKGIADGAALALVHDQTIKRQEEQLAKHDGQISTIHDDVLEMKSDLKFLVEQAKGKNR